MFMDFWRFKDGAAPILMYHGVGVGRASVWGDLLVSPQTFEAQMKYLQISGYKVVSVEELADRLAMNMSVKKYVAVTFDDGYSNNYEFAFPLLKKYGATGTFYIICNALGSEGYMGDTEIKNMLQAGMRIGCHTMSHSNLTVIDNKFHIKEILESKKFLEQRYGIELESISYPYGACNDKVVGETSNANYRVGVTGKYGINTAITFNDNPYIMNRVGVYGEDMEAKGLKSTLARAYLIGYLQYRGIDVIELRKNIKKLF